MPTQIESCFCLDSELCYSNLNFKENWLTCFAHCLISCLGDLGVVGYVHFIAQSFSFTSNSHFNFFLVTSLAMAWGLQPLRQGLEDGLGGRVDLQATQQDLAFLPFLLSTQTANSERSEPLLRTRTWRTWPVAVQNCVVSQWVLSRGALLFVMKLVAGNLFSKFLCCFSRLKIINTKWRENSNQIR